MATKEGTQVDSTYRTGLMVECLNDYFHDPNLLFLMNIIATLNFKQKNGFFGGVYFPLP